MDDRRAARAAAKRRRARRGAATAAVSTVVVVLLVVYLVGSASGWPEVRETFFSWDAFKTSFPEVAEAFWLDIRLFVVIELCVLVLGMVLALVRVTASPALFPLRAAAAVYADVFRGIPVILLIYLFGFGVPALDLEGVPSDPILLGGIALTLAYTAYVAEVYRAGIDSVHPSQRQAALAVGLTERQALRFVVVPQAVRTVVPPLLNDFISLQKDVALVYVLGVVEAFRVAQIDSAATFNYTPLLAVALLYLCVTIPMARLVDVLQKRSRTR